MSPSINEHAESKEALRARALQARSRLSAHARSLAAAEIRRRLAQLPELASARTVIGYAAFGGEVDVDRVLEDLAGEGRGVFLPFVVGEEIGIARVADLEADLVPGYRGVREPRAIGRRPANPARCEAAIVPGVAFDRRGGRLGYGGGHFDRLLARLRPQTPVIAVAFSQQLVEAVPREAHDHLVSVLVTEEETTRTGA